jgi:hypothetical protein
MIFKILARRTFSKWRISWNKLSINNFIIECISILLWENKIDDNRRYRLWVEYNFARLCIYGFLIWYSPSIVYLSMHISIFWLNTLWIKDVKAESHTQKPARGQAISCNNALGDFSFSFWSPSGNCLRRRDVSPVCSSTVLSISRSLNANSAAPRH